MTLVHLFKVVRLWFYPIHKADVTGLWRVIRLRFIITILVLFLFLIKSRLKMISVLFMTYFYSILDIMIWLMFRIWFINAKGLHLIFINWLINLYNIIKQNISRIPIKFRLSRVATGIYNVRRNRLISRLWFYEFI